MTTPTHRSSLALRCVPLFDGLSEQRLERLAQRCRWQTAAARKPLLLRADGPRDLSEVYFLLAGRLRVTIYSANGRQVSFRDLAEGDHFGDIAAIDGRPRSADVVTLAPSVLASLDRAGFLELLREEPLVAERVMRHLAALVRQLSERVIDLSTLGVQHRLHAELLRMAGAAGIDGNRARLDPAPGHAELASQISTGREQVTRELGVLLRDGVLARDGRALLVADVGRLARRVAEAQK